ncbi:hypothetical protein Hanom_Chr02g00174151 [Helianthus anomalus]
MAKKNSLLLWRFSSDIHTPRFAPKSGARDLPQNPEREICSFDNVDIAALHSSGAFPDDAIFRPFDRDLQSDVSSSE